MGNRVTRTDFEWTTDDEPHAKRRAEILKKHPEIKQLFGIDNWFKWKALAMVLVQFCMLFVMKDRSWPVTILGAYLFGGVINHSLMLAIHETSHGAAFGVNRPRANKVFGIFVNLPIGLPFAVSFKGYHLEHHRYQGDDLLDGDLPTYLEAQLFCTTLGKLVWVILQPLFYAFRPLAIHPKSPTVLEIVNVIIQLSFNYIVFKYFGASVFFYLLGGSLMAMGLHPVAGHFISEHYMFKKGFETYSYYGPLNLITFNVGFHNEHHDFPAVPGFLLPEVRKMAPEYYDNLPHHTSWTKVIYDFITDPSVGLYSRVKRKNALMRLNELQKSKLVLKQ